MATTYTGRLITPLNYGVPAPRDLAVSLGRMPRWAGGTRCWWSVLHHLRLCASLAEDRQVPVPVGQLGGHGMKLLRGMILLHEADEVVTGDIPTTWKCDAQRDLVRGLQKRTLEVYMGSTILCTTARQRDLAEATLKEIDLLALRAEAETVGPPGSLANSGVGMLFLDSNTVHAAEALVRDVLRAYGDPLTSINPGGSLQEWYLEALREVADDRALGAFRARPDPKPED